jgi:predicted metal-binding membrane protein
MESTAIRPIRPPPGLTRAAFTGVLLALAAGAWVVTVERMEGMDGGPGTALGGVGWFMVSWALMMAAMMLPSLVPAALAFARTGERSVPAFVAGYVGVWTAAGLACYLVFDGLRSLDIGFLAWDRAGRYVAAGVILAAAVYQFTTAKAGWLSRCRNPRGPGREVRSGLGGGGGGGGGGGVRGGISHGGYCLGCCVALIAALFALGVMSVTWMVVIAALIAVERLSPWHATGVYGVAVVLAVLGIWVAAAPGDLPGLTIPGSMAMNERKTSPQALHRIAGGRPVSTARTTGTSSTQTASSVRTVWRVPQLPALAPASAF